jgi:putative ABC transport system substrate-binding protein
MKKAVALSILVALIQLTVAVIADAQQPKKVFRIGVLSSGNPHSDASRYEPIRLALRELGYTENQNLTTEHRYAEGKMDRRNELAAELARLKVDMIVVVGGEMWVRAARDATKMIPIVMTGTGSDPVEEGLIESLARPGGNVTGITNLTKELGGKRLELLKEAVPKLVRVAVLYTAGNRGSVREMKEDLPVAARALKLTLQPWETRSADDFDRVFAAMGKQRPDGLYVASGPQMGASRKRIVSLALKGRVPSIYPNRDFVDAGGLMYYGADIADSYRQVAWYIDKILKGTKPADLPVQQPAKFEFVINLQTAKQIGVTIPPEVLARATKLIK